MYKAYPVRIECSVAGPFFDDPFFDHKKDERRKKKSLKKVSNLHV